MGVDSSDIIVTPYGLLNSRLNTAKLSELCQGKEGIQTGPFGSQLHQKDYVSKGTPIITVEHLGNNRILTGNIPGVTEKDRLRLKKYSLKCGDIVFSRVGSVDRRAIVREEEEGWLFSGRCLRVRPDCSKINPEYLSYFFGWDPFKDFIRSIAVGATMPSLNTKILSDVPIYFPSLPEQHTIARILGSLDDKIELNRRKNATLEAMAQAIFTSWFVDFDPVRAKAEGRQPEGMDEETAALFPDGFEVVDGREVPEGWSFPSIGDVVELAYGKALKKDVRREGPIPVYGSNGQVGWHDERLVAGPGIVVGRKGNPGVIVWSHTDFYPIDTTFYVILKNKRLSLHYIYYELLRQDLGSLGADSAVPGLNRNLAYMNHIIIPPDEILNDFDKLLSPLFSLIYVNDLQSHTLATIRDALLPKLISGEIRAPETIVSKMHGEK